jgi:hypothetical protein
VSTTYPCAKRCWKRRWKRRGQGVTEADIYAAVVAACFKNIGFTAEVLLGSGNEMVSWGPPTWTYRPHEPRVIETGDIVMAEASIRTD